MAAFDPRDRQEVNAARGNAGYGGGGYSGNRGGNAPQGERALQFGRYTPNPSVGYPATFGNLATAIMSATSPLGTLGRTLAGYGPSYTGPSYQTRGFDYDPTNRDRMMAGAGQSGQRQIPPGLSGTGLEKWLLRFGAPGQAVAQNQPQQQTQPALSQGLMGPKPLSVPGGSSYGLMAPGYSWFR